MTNKTHDFNHIALTRKSIRKYDSTVKISQAEMTAILTDATSAPSSLNMQPWRFVVVETPEGKEKIKSAMSFNGLQTETSSAIIFIFGDLNCVENLEKIMQGSVDHGTMTEEIKRQQIEKIGNYYQSLPQDQNVHAAILDGGLISMNLMLAARKYGYDTCPIGGYDKENIASILDINSERYLPIMALSIGKAAEDGYESYRLPVADITEWH